MQKLSRIAVILASLLLCSHAAHALTCDMAAQEAAGLSNIDGDFDCVNTAQDNCKTIPNPGQEDQNHDGIGDACQDSDSDGLMDWEELANHAHDPALAAPAPWRLIVTKITSAPKNPLTGKVCAQLATHTNPNNADTDNDGLSDYCELWFPNEADPVNADSDCDGKTDGAELGVAAGQIVKGCAPSAPKIIISGQMVNDLIVIFGNSSSDDAGTGGINPAKSNPNDADSDDDGIPDGSDNCPSLVNTDQTDNNHNGIGDACQVICTNGSFADAYGRCTLICNDGTPADALGVCSCASLGKVTNNAGYCVDPVSGKLVTNEPAFSDDASGSAAATNTDGTLVTALRCAGGTTADGACVQTAAKCNPNQLLFGENTCCDPRTETFDPDTLTCQSKTKKDVATPPPTTSSTPVANGCSLVLGEF